MVTTDEIRGNVKDADRERIKRPAEAIATRCRAAVADPELVDRYWSHVKVRADECWLWTGAISGKAHGRKSPTPTCHHFSVDTIGEHSYLASGDGFIKYVKFLVVHSSPMTMDLKAAYTLASQQAYTDA